MARAIMLQGTGSDVGKSVLVAGLCRVARNRGLKVRPFKPQNMSNNAAVAEMAGGGEGEIGRAQWLQALACGVAPTVDMNPVLLKPQTDTGAQVVVQGRVHGNAEAADYQVLKEGLLSAVMDSWRRVGEGADLVIVEGAGSPAEVNLRERDIANMGFATRADVPVILVGDIDRGGVIAALAGTHLVISPEDRAMVAGYIVNKFRGDVRLFDGGIDAIGQYTGWRCFGVLPWLRDAARLPSEDAVILDRRKEGTAGRLKVAVPMLPHISNFDDLDPLRAEPDVEVVFIVPGDRLPADAALVVIPGSKSTIADLAQFRALGWEEDLGVHRRRGGMVMGLCGGFQMLGRRLSDPDGIEGPAREAEGLGLLAVDTLLEEAKRVRTSSGLCLRYDVPLSGYEIHLGRTTGRDCARPFATIAGEPDGAISADGRVFGTYLHGVFGSSEFRKALLADFGIGGGAFDHMAEVERALDAIAAAMEEHLDCDALFALAR